MAKASSKSNAITAIDYLAKPDSYPAAAVCAVAGDDAFLKSAVIGELRHQVLGSEEGEFSLATLNGKDAELRDVFDALATVSLFGSGRRLAIVDEADPFVSQHREALEDYVAKPYQGGVLVLDVKTWPSNTRLAKAVAAT